MPLPPGTTRAFLRSTQPLKASFLVRGAASAGLANGTLKCASSPEISTTPVGELMISGSVLSCPYNYPLVALSVAISILGGYATLDLAQRIATLTGWLRWVWFIFGAVALGFGIWATNFVGLASLHLPVPVLYDWPTTLLSLLAAVATSALALFLVSRQPLGTARTLAGGVVLGSGMAATDSIAVNAMQLQAVRVSSPWLYWLWAVLAIAISFIALQLAFGRREDRAGWDGRRLAGGGILGLAAPFMHFGGMTAIQFLPDRSMQFDLGYAAAMTPLGLAAISIAAIVVLGNVCLVSSIGGRGGSQNGHVADRERLLQAIVDNGTAGIVVLDRKNKIVYANRADLGIFTLPAGVHSVEELVGVFDFFLRDGEPLPSDQRPSALAFRGTFVKNLELLVRSRETGKSAICEFSTFPIPGPAGENSQVVVSYRDITQQKRAEEKLRAVVDHAVDGLITIDERGKVENFNPACERIFGYSSAEVIGNDIKMLMPEPYHSEHAGYLSRYAAPAKPASLARPGARSKASAKTERSFPWTCRSASFSLKTGATTPASFATLPTANASMKPNRNWRPLSNPLKTPSLARTCTAL